MKSSMALMAAMATLFASCSNDEIRNTASPVEIGFNTTLSGVTRTVLDNSNFAQFKVTALNSTDGSAYFSDENVSKDGNSWFTENHYYWPDNALDFYAYAPTDLSNVTINQTTKQIIDFVPVYNVENQQDIVVAIGSGSKETNMENGVHLNFKHELAQIEVKATNERPSTYNVEVLGVKLGRVKTKATMTFPSVAGNHATWTDPTEVMTYGIKYDEAITLSTEAQSLMGGNDNWLMIPQSLTAWDTSKTEDQGFYLSVLLRITDKSGNVIYPQPKEGQEQSEVYAYSAVPVSATWAAGKKYTYTLKFFKDNGGAGVTDPDPTNPDPDLPEGDPDVDPQPIPDEPGGGGNIMQGTIFFTVNIEDWTPGDSEDITMEN